MIELFRTEQRKCLLPHGSLSSDFIWKWSEEKSWKLALLHIGASNLINNIQINIEIASFELQIFF